MRISELAARVGLRPSTLRFYEQAGLLPARRTATGHRRYDEEAVHRIAFITAAKRLGLPLHEIRDLLPVWQDQTCTDVRHRLRPLVRARLAETELRAAELRTATDRLRRSLATMDNPAPAGRCAPGCGVLPEADAPIACSLTGSAQANRVNQWQQLLAAASERHDVEDGLLFRLPAALAGQLAELAAAEQQCCPFFEFTLRLSAGALWLHVRAPREAAPLLAEVFASQPDIAQSGE